MAHGQGRVPPRPRQQAAYALWVASEAALRTPSSSWRENNPRKFSSNSENISRSKFLKQNNSKTRTTQLTKISDTL